MRGPPLMNVKDTLLQAVKAFSDRPAVCDGERSHSYQQVWTRACRLANGLLAWGFEPGTRVAVLEDNSIESLDVVVGLAIAGFVRVPLYAGSALAIQMNIVEHTNCQALIVSPAHADTAREMHRQDPKLRLLTYGASYETWLASADDSDPNINVSDEDLFIIRHSGGTTGVPKGVPISHRTWLYSIYEWSYSLPPLSPSDVFLQVSPLSHGAGYLLLPTWIAGACTLVRPAFDAADCLQCLTKYRVTYSFFGPADLNVLTRFASAAAVPPQNWLKAVITGGSPIAESTIRRLHKCFGQVLYQYYGQVEAGIISVMPPLNLDEVSLGDSRLQSCGRPRHDVQVCVLDDACEALPPGQVGEIAIRGHGVMSGYWKNPQKTATKFNQGWLLTGDLGRIDEQHYLYLLDRKEEMVVSSGMNIYPNEVENVLMGHTQVLEAVVFGVPDENCGEALQAICVLRQGANTDAKVLAELCRQALGEFKTPQKIVLQHEPLPRSAVGKIQRRAIRANWWGNTERFIHAV
ncbi:AMP-dependent synthetase and ligase [Pseudomonas syringae pv. syringae]|nr:AMP-dependent synthetase and ligase [Pseudomonas syringae pv. aceris]KPB22891.1 AMP-dependent synthetase and ligase [Pseudomonas syringae pv. syringae]